MSVEKKYHSKGKSSKLILLNSDKYEVLAQLSSFLIFQKLLDGFFKKHIFIFIITPLRFLNSLMVFITEHSTKKCKIMKKKFFKLEKFLSIGLFILDNLVLCYIHPTCLRINL